MGLLQHLPAPAIGAKDLDPVGAAIARDQIDVEDAHQHRLRRRAIGNRGAGRQQVDLGVPPLIPFNLGGWFFARQPKVKWLAIAAARTFGVLASAAMPNPGAIPAIRPMAAKPLLCHPILSALWPMIRARRHPPPVGPGNRCIGALD
jgi:hypothetical protein